MREMPPRQLPLLPKPTLEHGGSVRAGRRKLARPFDPRRPLHVVLRSSRARGNWSLLHPRNKARVHALLEGSAKRFGVRLYRSANSGNHLHLLLKARDRRGLQAFLRLAAGRIAFVVTGARKGKPVGRFWDSLAYSRVLGWGKELERVKRYLTRNLLEGLGALSAGRRKDGPGLTPVLALTRRLRP